MNFGDNLRKYRKDLGWSQSLLSQKTKIPQTTISDFENGKYLPNLGQVFILTKVFEISITDLINDEQSITSVHSH